MPRDFGVYLSDIIDAIDRVEEYTDGFAFGDFTKDQKTFDAVIRNLEVIGEAVKAIPDSIRVHEPDIDWRKIAGIRDVLIHEYFGVDSDIVWDVVQTKLPKLKSACKRLLESA